MSDDATRSILVSTRGGSEVSFRQSRLQVQAGPDRGLEVVLRERTYVLGRSEDADVTLRDPAVSRLHARLIPQEEGWRLVDLESKAGTWIGDLQVADAVVQPGREFRLGETRARVIQDRARVRAPAADSLGELVTCAPQMRALFGLIEKVASLEVPVLLLGESGTGKERLARAIHDASPRARGPYVVVDCTLLSEDSLRSELFGHRRGAFTGASSDRAGAFQRAASGTVVLDELGELPLSLQPMLLRALESGEVSPLGSDRSEPVDVRVVASTNRDLRAMVEAGEFRRDLFHRLSVLEVAIPPLRERDGDAVFLARHLLSDGLDLAPDAEAAIAAHGWPGNVRELENSLLRASLHAQGGVLRARDLGLDSGTPSATAREALPPSPEPASSQTIEELTTEAIRAALERNGGSRKATARELGIGRTTLYRYMKSMGFYGER